MSGFPVGLVTLASVLLVFCHGVLGSELTFAKLREAVVHGISITSDAGIKYFTFRGIPYARPPIGPLRFKAPQPYGNIKGSFLADKYGAVCPQIDPVSGKYIGDENCLTLNIYLPEEPQERSERKYPVVVFLHGGEFVHGAGGREGHEPYKLLEKDVIVVNFNYRLGVLGFLSTLDNVSPGNYGLLDQVEALRWIQQNIGAFGGDVNLITLFGHDAGAASALYHLLSQHSKGLFHQIIALSGSPLCDSYLQKDPVKWATELGIKLDCYIASSQTFLDCLRKRLPEEIVAAANELHKYANYPPNFLPVVERVHKENGDFLVDTPNNLLKENRINRAPIILGINKNAGVQFYRHAARRYSLRNNDTFFEAQLPEILQDVTSFKHNFKALSSAIKRQYYANINMEDEKQFENSTQEMFADLLVRRCNDKTAKYLSEAGWPTYMYVTEHVDTHGSDSDVYPDDLAHLFPPKSGSWEFDRESAAKIQRILLSIWTNFAKTSMPTPSPSHDLPLTWIPMNPGKIRYLSVDSKPTIVEGYLTERMKFWNVKMPKVEAKGNKDEL